MHYTDYLWRQSVQLGAVQRVNWLGFDVPSLVESNLTILTDF